jgi:stringent starvation protein B
VRVPNEYVKDGEIVLNISFDATSALKLGNEFIEFKGRFGGVARDILVPVNRVLAIYARENGQGMAFPMLAGSSAASVDMAPMDSKSPALLRVETTADSADHDAPKPPGPGRPSLTRVK